MAEVIREVTPRLRDAERAGLPRGAGNGPVVLGYNPITDHNPKSVVDPAARVKLGRRHG